MLPQLVIGWTLNGIDRLLSIAIGCLAASDERYGFWLFVVSDNIKSFRESTLANFTQKDCLLEELDSGISYNHIFPIPDDEMDSLAN